MLRAFWGINEEKLTPIFNYNIGSCVELDSVVK